MKIDIKKVAIAVIAVIFLSSIFVAGRGGEKITFIVKLPEGTFSKQVVVSEDATIAEALAQAFPSVRFENNTLQCIGTYCGNWKIYDSKGNEVSIDEKVERGESYFLIPQ